MRKFVVVLAAELLFFSAASTAASIPLPRTPSWRQSTMAEAVRLPGRVSYARRSGPAETVYASRKKKQGIPAQTLEAQNPEIPTFRELGPIGKVLVGSVQIIATTGVEYATGFLGAFVLGGIAGVPGLFTAAGPAPVPNEFAQRLARWNGKAVRWGKSWAPISAVYGGSDAAVRVLRGNVKDQWNTILSSAAAGAYFNRKGGPQAMLQGAAIYGGLTYVLSGGMMPSRNEQFGYQEEAVEF